MGHILLRRLICWSTSFSDRVLWHHSSSTCADNIVAGVEKAYTTETPSFWTNYGSRSSTMCFLFGTSVELTTSMPSALSLLVGFCAALITSFDVRLHPHSGRVSTAYNACKPSKRESFSFFFRSKWLSSPALDLNENIMQALVLKGVGHVEL